MLSLSNAEMPDVYGADAIESCAGLFLFLWSVGLRVAGSVHRIWT
jgi:hypothetical protein